MGILSPKRRCGKCGKKKPPSEFHRDNTRKDGLRPYCKACVKAYNMANADVLRQRAREWQENNPERARELSRDYQRRNPKPYVWRPITEKRREWQRRYARIWYQRHPVKIAIKRHLRRSRLLSAEGSWTTDEWRALCDWFGNVCLACGATEVTIDHVVPITNRGTNYLENLQPLCRSCNSRKNTQVIDYRDPELLRLFFEYYYNEP